ncbi:hypothetical protein SCLCIDRAFT_1213422 [Scleroderma citrinum Foug A]|uniref:Uncharacterized protein n=1 Tax=Scleroderma citrinum Foug A TaxID=1036808 RepID=A0A0C2ZS12_9AGAM|nr:hypothetical protein SCLCIDRAFT_1213422 [Scleroderma citrinum Foug A]
MLVKTPEHAEHMNSKARSGAERYGQVRIMQTRLPRTTSILQISSIMWKSSRMCGVKLGVFHDSGFGVVSSEWTAFDVNGTDDLDCDWRGLMILDQPRKYGSYEIDGVPGNFSAAPDGIKLGDYGHLMDSKEFCCEGILFADLELLSLAADITPRQHRLSSMDRVAAWNLMNVDHLTLYEPLMLSLPRNDDLKSLLTSLSTPLTNRYLVLRVIQYFDVHHKILVRHCKAIRLVSK